MEKQLVETIYTPFVQKNITTTYASANKYSAPGALDAQSKFANDLDQLKIKQSKDKKIPKKKEEFTVELDKELEHKLTFIQKETSFAKKNTAVTNQVGESHFSVIIISLGNLRVN